MVSKAKPKAKTKIQIGTRIMNEQQSSSLKQLDSSYFSKNTGKAKTAMKGKQNIQPIRIKSYFNLI